MFGTIASGKLTKVAKMPHFHEFLNTSRTLIVRCAQERRALPSINFVARCKLLKNAYNRCDTDGNHEISRTELEIALQKLGLVFSDEELEAILTRLDPNGDGRIEWSDFLYAAWQDSRSDSRTNSSALHQYLSVELFTELPSFICAPVDRQRKQQPTSKHLRRGAASLESNDATKGYFSRMERMGVEFLTRVSETRHPCKTSHTCCQVRASQLQSVDPQEELASILSPPEGGKALSVFVKRSINGGDLQHQKQGPKESIIPKHRYGFAASTMRQLRPIEWAGTVLGFVIGFVCGLTSMGLEGLLPSQLTADAVWGFNGYVFLINIAVSLLEVTALYVMAVICWTSERYSFWNESHARISKLVLLMTYLMYKSKRYVVKFLLKLFIKRVLWRAAARSTVKATVLPIQ
ncbi:Calcium-binding protein 7 [Phytophthora palmivora]|uniref:Calcium-binding protein 7 n=1 Tax=Phytophthora palmivora TaxID=4796 RepID=A0A2P4XTI3_9STRA|nr:Calcium-binding protein 7 [Phytophthora palmivora]